MSDYPRAVKSNTKAPDYRIGCKLWKYAGLSGVFSLKDEDNEDNTHIKQGRVFIHLHTHGIRIYSGFFKSFNLHYSFIDSIKYVQPELIKDIIKEGIKSMLTSGGSLLDGAQGMVGGAIDSQSAIRIQYRDPDTGDKTKILIHTKSRGPIDSFIENYNKEIEITKRTNRSPNVIIGTLKALGKTILIIAGILFALIIAFIILFIVHLSNTEPVHPPQEDLSQPTEDLSSEPIPIPSETSQNDNGWNIIGDTNCQITSSSGTLTLIKDQNALELQSKAIYEGINIVSIVFDHNKPFETKCTSLGSSKIRIAADKAFIKKMKNGTNMKVIIPSTENEDKTLRFSLMGFSNACKTSIN